MNATIACHPVRDLVGHLPGWVTPVAMPAFLAVRYFPDYEAEWFESLCSPAGTLFEGRFVLVHPEAGYQANILRSGLWCAWWLCRHLRDPKRLTRRLCLARKTTENVLKT